MTNVHDQRPKRRKLLPEMEGATARWYARQRGTEPQLAEYRTQAARLAEGLSDGAEVLEVAPGPGYLAIELARSGRLHVTGLDISSSMIEIASEKARRQGVAIDFRHGDASAMPFGAESFDLIICQAAFKNFVHPVRALDEMHRVLRPGGAAVIQDLRRDVLVADIDEEVARMALSGLSAFMTKWALVGLRRRAYTRTQFERLATASAFPTCAIHNDGIGVEVRLTKPNPS